jgi:hypothetical protein
VTISKAGADCHDWFGNFRCDLNLDDLMEFNFFYVEDIEFAKSTATRILVTIRKRMSGLQKINIEKERYGFPVISFEGTYHIAVSHVMSGIAYAHSVHFLLSDDLPLSELFRKSRKIPVNHSNANTMLDNGHYVQHQCLIYNGGLKCDCPAPFTPEQTKQAINKNECGFSTPKSVKSREHMF